MFNRTGDCRGNGGIRSDVYATRHAKVDPEHADQTGSTDRLECFKQIKKKRTIRGFKP